MSLNHICEGGLADVSLDVKGITIQGQPVGLQSLALDQAAYPALDLAGVGTVYLASGPNTIISGVTGATEGQSVKFMTCKQASAITIQSFGTIQTTTGADIVLSGLGECAQGVWSDSLGYLTVTKTS